MIVEVLATAAAACLLYVLSRSLRRSTIPGPPNYFFWKGNIHNLFNPDTGFAYGEAIAAEYGAVVKLTGFLGDEQFYVSDPRALHDIVIRHSDLWDISDDIASRSRLVFGPGLFSAQGLDYKRQRKILNRVFTPECLRNLVPLFYAITVQMLDILSVRIDPENPPLHPGAHESQRELTPLDREIDVLDLISLASLEYIGQGVLGYNFHALDGLADEYSQALKIYFPSVARLSILRGLWPVILAITNRIPHSLRYSILKLLPVPLIHNIAETTRVLDNCTRRIWEQKTDPANLDMTRDDRNVDILTKLIQANAGADPQDRLSEEELMAQLSILVLTAQDTTSGALARTLSMLAKHPEFQERLRAEIIEAREANGGANLDYDTLCALPYLDAVCRETLRVHTTAPMFPRVAQRDTILPLLWPVKGTDGKMITELPIRKGGVVHIAIHAANVDPRIWGPDAHIWRPERWLEKLPDSVKEARLPGIYSNMMSFLGGPRACLGFRFSQLEMKIVLFMLIESFVFEPTIQDVHWLYCTTLCPHVRGQEHLGTRLPMRVSRFPGVLGS